MPTESEFLAQVRDALNHLYDYPYLADHALALRFWPGGLEGAERAQRLHRLLLESIEQLNPATSPTKDPSRARSYALLAYYYVEGWNRGEIMQELICSRRQFFREQQKALMLLAAVLWGRLPEPDASPGESADPLLTEAGLILAQRELVAPRDVVMGVIQAIGPLAEQHGVTLECEAGANLPCIRANRTLLRQVLLRALSELIARPGTAEIDVRLDVEGQKVRVELAARCAPPAPNALDDPPLEAARRLAEMVGGEWERSRPASGADVCCFSFPVGDERDQILLVIEDNEGVVRAFARYLAGSRYRVVGATSGAEALRLARELEPAAITLDVMMPAQDGWEVLQALKNDPGTRHIPVIVCSALDDPELARSLHAAAFLRKPIAQADLISALSGLVSPNDDKGGPAASSRARR